MRFAVEQLLFLHPFNSNSVEWHQPFGQVDGNSDEAAALWQNDTATNSISYFLKLITQLSQKISIASQPADLSAASYSGQIVYSEEIFSVPSLSVVVQDASTVYVQAVVSGVQSDLIVLEAENEKQCYLSLSGWSVCDLGQLLMFLSTVWMLWIVQAHHSIFIVGPVSLIIMIILLIIQMK